MAEGAARATSANTPRMAALTRIGRPRSSAGTTAAPTADAARAWTSTTTAPSRTSSPGASTTFVTRRPRNHVPLLAPRSSHSTSVPAPRVKRACLRESVASWRVPSGASPRPTTTARPVSSSIACAPPGWYTSKDRRGAPGLPVAARARASSSSRWVSASTDGRAYEGARIFANPVPRGGLASASALGRREVPSLRRRAESWGQPKSR